MGSIDSLPNFLSKKLISYRALRNYFSRVKLGDTIFVQYPLYISYPAFLQVIYYLRIIKHCKLIFIVHDLNSLRIDPTIGLRGMGHTNDGGRSLKNELRILKLASDILVPTEAMREFLKNTNKVSANIIVFGLYEHLTDSLEIPRFKKKQTMIFAGNLNKAGFLEELGNSDFHYEIYGKKPSSFDLPKNLDYRGAFASNELAGQFKGGFGLVWDGFSSNGISGVMGEYLRYNSPFKASMFLSSGLPIVVWEQAAIADFVRQQHLGITVSSLKEAELIIRDLTDEQYAELAVNVRTFALQLRQGVHFIRAIKDALA
ncbi:hypothetical protein OFW50_09465 [Lacticaseibacillus chiayiensis]|nr:hypothetical protein [Lacticaseibacillus chiayiensis]UYN55710.1 hypothetical protein OFW50_09465 [Lacticaseibacillus chiayiensis]